MSLILNHDYRSEIYNGRLATITVVDYKNTMGEKTNTKHVVRVVRQ